ncbi:MAG: hypothetical protein CM1200mP2_23580 [Planctomycetaceae bacterium]|nr:MAG: hypothetical protein CM1200mP2_23580 [Planctomycetaceae bacterium]
MGIADLVRGKEIAVFSDEPYCHMVGEGGHHSLLEQPGMMDQCVAAYTFSKSYSMSGWRLGFAVTSERIADWVGKMINTSLSCTPPLVQLAGPAALGNDHQERDRVMGEFRDKVVLLTDGLNAIDGIHSLDPTPTFYVFPNVMPVCNRRGIRSHGLACTCWGGLMTTSESPAWEASVSAGPGAGFLRFSCAEPNERLQQAWTFCPKRFREPIGLRLISRAIPSSGSRRLTRLRNSRPVVRRWGGG